MRRQEWGQAPLQAAGGGKIEAVDVMWGHLRKSNPPGKERPGLIQKAGPRKIQDGRKEDGTGTATGELS